MHVRGCIRLRIKACTDPRRRSTDRYPWGPSDRTGRNAWKQSIVAVCLTHYGCGGSLRREETLVLAFLPVSVLPFKHGFTFPRDVALRGSAALVPVHEQPGHPHGLGGGQSQHVHLRVDRSAYVPGSTLQQHLHAQPPEPLRPADGRAGHGGTSRSFCLLFCWDLEKVPQKPGCHGACCSGSLWFVVGALMNLNNLDCGKWSNLNVIFLNLSVRAAGLEVLFWGVCSCFYLKGCKVLLLWLQLDLNMSSNFRLWLPDFDFEIHFALFPNSSLGDFALLWTLYMRTL